MTSSGYSEIFRADEWDDSDQRHSIAAVDFDYRSLDECEAFAREALKIPGAFKGFIRCLKAAIGREVRVETLQRIIGTAKKFSQKHMAVDLLYYVSGIAALDGKNGVDFARIYGISKEAWQQQAEKMRRILELRKPRTMRSDGARSKMTLRNFRRAHHTMPKSHGNPPHQA